MNNVECDGRALRLDISEKKAPREGGFGGGRGGGGRGFGGGRGGGGRGFGGGRGRGGSDRPKATIQKFEGKRTTF